MAALLLYAQPLGRVARIGFLGSASATGSARSVEALRTGLRDLGYVEGRNIVIDFRWAEGKYDRLSELVAELIRLNVDVMVNSWDAGDAHSQSGHLYDSYCHGDQRDAIATGPVTEFREAKQTSLDQLSSSRNLMQNALNCSRKPVRMLLAWLRFDPNNPVSKPIIPAMQAAATPLKLEFDVAEAEGPGEVDSAFASMVKRRVDAIVVTEDGELAPSFGAIATLAVANKLASIGAREYAQAGGLIGYGGNLPSLYRRAAYFVNKILKGAKPADLPIEQPTGFELVINSRPPRRWASR